MKKGIGNIIVYNKIILYDGKTKQKNSNCSRPGHNKEGVLLKREKLNIGKISRLCPNCNVYVSDI